MDFETAFNRLLGFEGGYSNNPADPGGATRFGITEAVARVYGYKDRMEDLPLDTARNIYKDMYWDKVRADDLPEGIRYDLFDAAVNSGAAQAIRWLQAACGATVDGIVGPATISAAKTAEPVLLSRRYSGLRLAFLTTLPGWATFGKGWARRIASILTQ